MQLITLNIWGGKLYKPLLDFIKRYSRQVDIFCFQEVYQASSDKLIARKMHADIYGEIRKILPEHQGYFAPHLIGGDLNGKVDFPVKSGLAIFIREGVKVKECKDIFIYRSGCKLLDDDIMTIPRNLQYISFVVDNKDYLVGHFHGIWHPKSKVDTKDRIKQSQIIKDFLSKRKELKILCGDFNLLPLTKSMKLLEEDLRNLVKEYNIPTTRNKHYKRGEKHADYVLISPDIEVEQFGAVAVEASDHLPLLLEFS